MSRTAYLNGEFLPLDEARVPVMDRGFLFADGIYEVAAVLHGRLVDNAGHLARLDRSLREIRIPNPYDAAEWTRLCQDLVRRNGLAEAWAAYRGGEPFTVQDLEHLAVPGTELNADNTVPVVPLMEDQPRQGLWVDIEI